MVDNKEVYDDSKRGNFSLFTPATSEGNGQTFLGVDPHMSPLNTDLILNTLLFEKRKII